MDYVQKLDITFAPAQILKAELMNLIVGRINEVVDSANLVHEVKAYAEDTRKIVDSNVDISQAEFEAMQEAGTLDITKNYYTYEEE